MDPLTSEENLTSNLIIALRDCDQWSGHRPYIWKPKSMEKLASMGLVEPDQLMSCGRIPYSITAKGREYLAKLA